MLNAVRAETDDGGDGEVRVHVGAGYSLRAVFTPCALASTSERTTSTRVASGEASGGLMTRTLANRDS